MKFPCVSDRSDAEGGTCAGLREETEAKRSAGKPGAKGATPK